MAVARDLGLRRSGEERRLGCRCPGLSPRLLILPYTPWHRATHICEVLFHLQSAFYLKSPGPPLEKRFGPEHHLSPFSSTVGSGWTVDEAALCLALVFFLPVSVTPHSSSDLLHLVLSSNGWWAMDMRLTSGKTVAPP